MAIHRLGAEGISSGSRALAFGPVPAAACLRASAGVKRVSWLGVSGDGGRVITIGFVGGQIGTKGCDDTYQARVVQEKAIVVVFVAETRVIPPGVLCALPGYGDHLSVKLTKPIGSRVLVDGAPRGAVPV